VALARILLARGDRDEALALVEPLEHDFLAAGLTARAALEADGDELAGAFHAWDEGDHAAALDELQTAFAAADPERRDAIRKVMVAIFTELGADDPLAREHRRRLSAVLY
jgi:thioredoxin-like negative regulator of GroEL